MRRFILMCTFFLFVAGFSVFAQFTTLEDKIKHAAINSTIWDGINDWFVVRKKQVGTDSVAMLVGGYFFKLHGDGGGETAFSYTNSNNYTNSNARAKLATEMYAELTSVMKASALRPVLGDHFSLDVTTEPMEPLQVGNANQDVLFCLSYRDAVNWQNAFPAFWSSTTFGVGAYSRWWLRTGWGWDGSALAYEVMVPMNVFTRLEVATNIPSIRPAVWVKYGTSGFSISGTVSGLQDNVGITVYYTVNNGAQQSVTTTANGANGVYIINNIPSGADVVITASNQTGYVGTVSPTPATNNVTSNIEDKNISYSPIYTLTYDGNNHTSGTAPTGGTYNAGVNVGVSGPGNLLRTCYTFMGWARTNSATEPEFAYSGGAVFPTQITMNANITLYAVWKGNYSIIGVVSGLTNNDNIPVYYTINSGSQQTVYSGTGGAYIIGCIPHGANVVVTASPKTNYTATVSPDPATNNMTKSEIGKDITYSPIQYTLTYNGNNHTSGTPPAGGTYNVDTNVGVSGPGNLLRTCYTFMGWARTSTATEPEFVYNGSTFSPTQVTVNAPITLYAVWKGDYSIKGTVSGLQNNVGVTVYYIVNSGVLQSVTTTAGGAYTIPCIPHGADVAVIASPQLGYVSTVSPTPETDNMTKSETGKDIRYDAIGFTVNNEDYKNVDGRSYCDVSNFTFTAYPSSLASSLIEWRINGIVEATNVLTFSKTLAEGYYTVMLLVESVVCITHFAVGNVPVVWTPEANAGADKRNWRNPANWTPAIIPSTCNDVYIPGNLEYYPQLTTVNPGTCRDIHFIQGAELGRPDLLTYSRAYVQMNFGLKQYTQNKNSSVSAFLANISNFENRREFFAAVSDPLDRERWYILSSPLHGVVSGDLSFGGFPLTFMRKFGPVNKDEVNYPVGQWTTPYNSLTELVSPSTTDGYAFFMYGYGMAEDGDNTGCSEDSIYGHVGEFPYLPTNRNLEHYGIREVNGIIELPFFEEDRALIAHRTQVYESATKQSTFFYINDNPHPDLHNRLNGTSHSVDRLQGDGNYRFIPENQGSWSFPPTVYHSGSGLTSNTEFLVGNPYMSSIDMNAFFNSSYNSSRVKSEYKLWTGKDFYSYTRNGSTFDTNDPNPINSGYIAPMQGFFLKTGDTYSGSGGDNVVAFDVSSISTTRQSGLSNLRSSAVEENKLRIKAENNWAESHVLIGYRENVSDGFNSGVDVQKLFSFLSSVPEVYALAGEIPTDIRYIGDRKEIIVPLGIKTGRTGEIRLTFTGMDNYAMASKIELVDAQEKQTVDLTGKSSYTCTFNHTVTGIQNGRFSLRISNSMTDLPDVNDPDNLKIYGDSKGIYVISLASDPVQQVIIYDLQGKKLFESRSGEEYYPLQNNFGNLPLIVKAVTKNQTKTVRIRLIKN